MRVCVHVLKGSFFVQLLLIKKKKYNENLMLINFSNWFTSRGCCVTTSTLQFLCVNDRIFVCFVHFYICMFYTCMSQITFTAGCVF